MSVNNMFVNCLNTINTVYDFISTNKPGMYLRFGDGDFNLAENQNGDSFMIETIFKNENEFFEKISAFEKDNELYIKCLSNQHYIVKKYFNINWIKNYILSRI